MNLTIGVRSRRRVVPRVKFGFSWSEFDGEFEYRFGSVGSGRNIELRGLTRGINRGLLLEIAGSYVYFDGRFGIYVKFWVT